jgi:hypothetical protein
MRVTSLRVLLLALALALQTIAGGWSVARAAPAGQNSSAALHCHRLTLHFSGHDGAPAENDRQNPMCPSCLLCDGPPAVSLPTLLGFSPASSSPEALRAPPAESSAFSARSVPSRFARGPPVAAGA